MRPVLFSLFGRDFDSATSFAGLAALVAFLVMRAGRARARLSADELWELAAFLAAGVFAGSVAFHAFLYDGGWAVNLAKLRAGGLGGGSFLGSLSGAALAAAAWTRWRGKELGPVADVLVEAGALGLAVMRVGCVLNGCCHGRPTGTMFGLVFDGPCAVAPAFRGMHLQPTQLYDAAVALALYVLLARGARPLQERGVLRPGDGFWLFAGLYGLFRLGSDPLRGDDRPVFAALGMTPAQWTGALAALASGWTLTKRPWPKETVYGAAVASAFLVVAAWRSDLVAEAAGATAASLAAGGEARRYVLGEMALFAGILVFAWRVIPRAYEPRRDGLILLVAGLAGWLAEFWGTRLGLWTYYTGEMPPLWIVPAWCVGALVIDRLAARARAARVAAWLGPSMALFSLAATSWLSLTGPGGAWRWAGPAVVAFVLIWRRRPEDGPILLAGILSVFFADLWGTTNGCWDYHLAGWKLGLWQGIAFGMGFDAAVVLGALKVVDVCLTRRKS